MPSWGAQKKPDEEVEPKPTALIPEANLRFRRLRADGEALAIVQAVARARHVTMRSMLSPRRGYAATAAARQLAMYLVHVLLARPQDVVGRLFGRDASTVSHACRTIEDLRENPPLEAEIAAVEQILRVIKEQRHVA